MKTIYYHFKSIDSTSTHAKRQIGLLDKSLMTIIYADEQTAGRGRFDHRWHSPDEGNLYATFCFHLTERVQECSHFSIVAALPVADLLEEYGVSPTLKWPNDLQINGKKIGGVLIETSPTDDGLFLFCGIGLDINMSPQTLSTIDIPATSLYAETGKKHDVQEFLHRLEKHFSKAVSLFLQEGIAPFLPRYRELTHSCIGKNISFRNTQGKRIEGIFIGINPHGALILQLPSGESILCYSGEIE